MVFLYSSPYSHTHDTSDVWVSSHTSSVIPAGCPTIQFSFDAIRGVSVRPCTLSAPCPQSAATSDASHKSQVITGIYAADQLTKN